MTTTSTSGISIPYVNNNISYSFSEVAYTHTILKAIVAMTIRNKDSYERNL